MNIVRKTFLRITQLFITAKLNISFNSINLINSTSSPRTVRQVENLMVIDWYSFEVAEPYFTIALPNIRIANTTGK